MVEGIVVGGGTVDVGLVQGTCAQGLGMCSAPGENLGKCHGALRGVRQFSQHEFRKGSGFRKWLRRSVRDAVRPVKHRVAHDHDDVWNQLCCGNTVREHGVFDFVFKQVLQSC